MSYHHFKNNLNQSFTQMVKSYLGDRNLSASEIFKEEDYYEDNINCLPLDKNWNSDHNCHRSQLLNDSSKAIENPTLTLTPQELESWYRNGDMYGQGI